VDSRAVDRYGRTPPVYAIWNGHAAVDKRLLRAYRRYPRGPPKITQKINNTTFDWIECFSSLKMCTNYTCWSSDNCSPSFSRIINVLVSFGSPFLTRCKTAWTSATFPGVLLRWFGSTGSYGRDWGFSASGGVEIILLLDQGDPFPTLPGVFCTSATSLWYSSRPKLSLEQHAKPPYTLEPMDQNNRHQEVEACELRGEEGIKEGYYCRCNIESPWLWDGSRSRRQLEFDTHPLKTPWYGDQSGLQTKQCSQLVKSLASHPS